MSTCIKKIQIEFPMSKTKEEIVRYATQLILEKGYNAFSYADISKQLKIKNAAIHYHFPSKEDLGAEVMKKQVEHLTMLMKDLKNRQISEVEQLEVLFDIYLGLLENKQICALGSMGSDIKTLSPKIQVEVRKDYELASQWVFEILENGRSKGLFSFDGSAKVKGEVILNNLIAGVMMSRLYEDAKQQFRKTLQQILDEMKV